ncbi:MAG TPA: Rieske 2Fe-2S domain-containing protein [Candidatus Acidoferrum sp.]|nr:Rieske 2Fe-2S domain-containing protein [Candidatus Acidoferrum sp.]
MNEPSSVQPATVPGAEHVTFIKRNVFQRAFGICVTREPHDRDSWNYAGDRVVVDLGRVPELSPLGGAVRLEGNGIPVRILVVHTSDGRFHAFENKCTHKERRLDPVPGTETLQCCSMGKSTFDPEGDVLYGPANAPLKQYAVEVKRGHLVVSLN